MAIEVSNTVPRSASSLNVLATAVWLRMHFAQFATPVAFLIAFLSAFIQYSVEAWREKQIFP